MASEGFRSAVHALAAAAALLLRATVALGATFYHTEDEALRIAFPSATSFESRSHPLGEPLRARVSERVGYAIPERLVVLREARRDGTLLGWALVLEEIGKTMPFRFLVAFEPAGAVDQVLLLTYREPRGYEIGQQTFRAQYQGKTLADPIRRGDDIRNISGATLSVDSLSRGVRRALALREALVPPGIAVRPPQGDEAPAQ